MSMDTEAYEEVLEEVLEKQHFLKDLDERYQESIADCAFDIRFNKGDFLCREGEPAHRFYIITKGKVALETFAPERGSIIIETLGEDELLGWSWLFPPYRWHFDALALEDTEAIAFDARCLRGKCEADHDLGYEVVKRFTRVIMERLQATRLRLLDVYNAAHSSR
jgi:CRP/FNR family cyclic AMP-dependent transcriptional regulator